MKRTILLLVASLLIAAIYSPAAEADCLKCNGPFSAVFGNEQCIYTTCHPAGVGQSGRESCQTQWICSPYPGPPPQGPVACTMSGDNCTGAERDPFFDECVLYWGWNQCCGWYPEHQGCGGGGGGSAASAASASCKTRRASRGNLLAYLFALAVR